jgi:N6-adenosine-specific RNA methylase IME4
MGLIRCVAADPPWLERGGGRVKRGADRHYDLMPTEQILLQMASWLGVAWWSGSPLPECRIDVVRGCHLWLWVTDNFLLDGLFIMRSLGYRYIRTLQWVKVRDLDEQAISDGGSLDQVLKRLLQKGLGQYLRGSHEMVLFGVRGESMVPPTEDRMDSVVFAQRTPKHSEKPDEAIQVMERVSPGPRLELYARNRRPGWEAMGNEVDG